MNKEDIKEREKQLLELAGDFCSQHLDADYFHLCEKLIKKMGRKRDIPFKRGKLEIWAAATVHAIGSINFLFDRSFEPCVSALQICDYFATKKTTVSNKAREIKEMFDLMMFDKEFATQRMTETDPFKKLVMVDGFIVPISSIPKDLQELVRKERAAGRDIEFTSQPD